MHLLYNTLLWLLSPITILRLLIKSRHNPEYRHHILERFAYKLPLKLSERPLWIHSVSVGEFLAIKPLLEALLSHFPNLTLWITCTTPTGRAQIRKFATQHPKRIQYSYLPYDTPNNIQRFIRHLTPCGLVLMETEIWINLLSACQQKNIPTLLINARLSKKSLRAYYRFARPLLRKVLPKLRINAQSKADAKRFRTLCPHSAISITPSLKFVAPSASSAALTDFLPANNTPILIAASTHEGEEALILQAYQTLQHQGTALRLCIAPRHPERRETIIKLIEKAGYQALLRSQNAQLIDNKSIAILDTLGELSAAMRCATVVFIGGSLIPRGGHNPLEAIHAGVPVCFGNSMFNFQHIAEQLLREPFVQMCHAETLANSIQALLAYTSAHTNASILSYSQQHNQNILNKHLDFISQNMAL